MAKTILIFIFWLIVLIGEIKCVIKFFQCDFKESYKAECIYGFSAITGIGAVVGYLDFGK